TNYVDSTAPKIQFVSPTESTNTVIPRNWTYINVTINETTPENITLQWNGVNESLTCIGVSPDYYCGINKTSLADGNYSYLVYVNDSVGNSNKTETRYIYIDTTAPIVNFVAPTPNNNNVSAVNWTFIQISDVEYNHNNATLNWNGTNYAMSCAGARPNYNCWINLTDLTDGNYSYYACATDINNLTSCTETRNITILRLFYLIDMNPSLKAILTYNNTVDAATVGLSGLQYVTLQTIAGINISNFTVDYNQDHNWSNVTADINTTTGISYIHVPSGHNEISTSKTLYIPVILGLGSAYICPDAQNETQVTRTCTNIDYRWNLINESGFYKVNVSGTGGHEGTLANLTIFDDTNDPEGENLTHIINQNVGFYANFTNITNSPIDNTNGVTCEITFNVSGIWSAPASMIYNSSTKLWQYYRSFTSEGTFNYNITCNGTRQAYELLQAQDNFTLNATAIFINNVSATPSFGILNTPIMISANITSPIALGQAWLNVTGPTGTYAELMVETVPDIYNYTFPNTNAYGTYTYSIWVSDSFGNAIQSTSYTFQIVGVNSKSYIYTENTSYGINEIVNLKNESNLNDWWNYAWNKRKAILLSEGQGIERTNEIITLNITDLNLTNYCDELRIVSKWSGTPTETPYQLLDNGTNWCEVLFLANISSHATNEEIFHAYFENPAAAAPVYSDQVILSAFGGEANHQISATNYLLQFETTNDLPETFISRVGTYQQDFIDEWGGCNGAGMVSDTSASWRDECNDAGVVTLIEDGTLRSILNIYKSNLGTLDYINKTYVFYPTYFTIEVTIRGGGTSNTNNNEVSFIRVNYAAEGGEPFRNFNFETSTGTDPDTIECSGGHELVGGWSSDWASVFRTGFEASYSFQVVSDPLSSINSYEYYEGGVECGASSKQDIDIDNDEVSGPVTLGFIPHGEENTNLFARDDSIKLKNPVTVVLDSEKTANETFSVIINSGLVSFNGSVVMTIEYFNTTISNWQHITTIVNETATSTVHTILPNTYLNTGNLWNPTSWNTSTYPSGTYRATQILLNSSDEPVLNQNGSSIYKDYEFQIYYERSSVNQSYLTNNNILDSETAEMNCQIFDPTTNTAHENYLVSFYRNGTLLGTNTTNASGYAIFRWTESIGTYFIVCNITDDLPNSIYATDPTEGVDILTVWPAGADTTKPIITAVSDTPDPANISDTITIRANVTDNKNVSLVQVFVRRPGEDTWTPFNMTEINVGATGNGTYEFNYTLTNMGGYFTYYVYAEDNWTTPNWQRSSYQNFFIAVVKAISKIKTEETLYKGMTDVLIDSYTTYKTTDVEPGSQSTSMKYSYFTNGFEDSSGIGLAGLNVTIWNFQNGDGNDIDITNTVRNSGTYALHLQDGNPVSWVESNAGLINLSGQTSCNISIARRVDSMEGTDDWANLDIFDGSWNNGIGVWGPPQSGFGWATQSYSLDSYNLIENFQIRMRMTSTADDDEAYFDDIAITCENDDQSENYVNYNIGGIATINTSYVELTIQVDEYDSRGSTTTTEPDIQVGIWTGSSYLYNNYCELDKIYDSNSYTVNSRNCTIVIDNPTIVAAWENPANRNIRVRGTFLDANSNGIDKVQWSGIWGTFVTPSIIANTGSREINGRILLQVYNNDTNTLVGTVYNQSYNISVDEKINISSIWNSNPFNTLNFPTGTYYAYSAVVNDVGAVIQNPSGSFVEDKSYFNLQYMTVNITSPIDNTTYLTDNITLNATLDTTYFASGGWCGYSLDGQINITMTQLNPINFTYQLESLSGGNHSVIVYCNDSAGDISMSQNVTFNVDKDTVSIIYPTFEYLLDRDETQSAYNDSVNLTVRTGEFIAGLNVSYYIKRVEPNSIADQNNSILIGSVLTNASGYAVLPFNPNSSIYAGNYSWWGEIPAGTSMQNGTLLIYGSLNTIFTNINSQPEQYYLKTENIEINSTIESMGIENFTILNNTYNFTTLYNISSPSAIKVYDNLTRNGNYFVGNYLTAITDETGIWNATLYSNAKYFFAVNTSRDFSVANKIAVIGKLTYDDTNSPNIIFNLSITNLVNATINTTAFIYVPSNYLLTGINETATTKILSGIYDGRSHQVNLTLNNYQTKIIAYNATLTYNSSRKMQEAIMFGIDPR
ncbi:hypothetical protein JXM83_07235, partial [Candidatus Woesearchaeota archaeon]|nr:hypothetical protein [Candidatus Woesearchaeota archaeon]